jgi:hypothetical protein
MIAGAGSPDCGWILRDLITGDAIRYGDPCSFSGLTVVPVFTARPAPLRYALLADAVASGVAACPPCAS